MGSPRYRRNQRLKCVCGGYHFPHRRGGGACRHGPRGNYYEALRCGLSVDEAKKLLNPQDLARMFPEEDRRRGELALKLTRDRVIDMPTARAIVDNSERTE